MISYTTCKAMWRGGGAALVRDPAARSTQLLLGLDFWRDAAGKVHKFKAG